MNPTISCVFAHTAPLGMTADEMLSKLTDYVKLAFGPVWSVQCSLKLATAIQPGTWGLVFSDDADQANALGYHETTSEGLPLGHVFVHTSNEAGEPITCVASHELAEMLADPGCNLGAFSPRRRWIALEVCDPVESGTFHINGTPFSNFVRPSWFGGVPDAEGYDYLKLCAAPWQLLPGGYVPVFANGRWTQIFGSRKAKKQYGEKDRRGHRPERRMKNPRQLVGKDAPPLAPGVDGG